MTTEQVVYTILAVAVSITLVVWFLIRAARLDCEALLAFYSGKVDKMILDELASGTMNYVSGKFILTDAPLEKLVEIEAELFFQDAQGKWLKKNLSGKKRYRSLRPEFLKELREKREWIFEIVAPQK